MALVARGNGAGFFCSVTLVDTQGDPSTLRYELQGTTFAEASANRDAIVAALAGVSASAISSTSLSYVEDEDTFAFPSGADNGVRARMTFQLANSVEKATLDIPAPANAIFASPQGPNNNIVDLTDPAVIAYVQLFQTGGEAYISDGELTDFALRGKRTTR